MLYYKGTAPMLSLPDDEYSLIEIFTFTYLHDADGICKKLASHILAKSEFNVLRYNYSTDLINFFKRTHADALIANIDDIPEYRMLETVSLLGENLTYPPFIVLIGKKMNSVITDCCERYKMKVFHIQLPNSLENCAASISQYVASNFINPEIYLRKISDCLIFTLRLMNCDETRPGFSHIVDAAMNILFNPYTKYPIMQLYAKIGESQGVKPMAMHNRIKRITDTAFDNMDENMRDTIFFEEAKENRRAEPVDFIYAAARLASGPCRKCIRYIMDNPLIPEIAEF